MSSRTTRSTRMTRSSMASQSKSPMVIAPKATTRAKKAAAATTTKSTSTRTRHAKKEVMEESDDELNNDDAMSAAILDRMSSTGTTTPLATLSASKQNVDSTRSPFSPTSISADRFRRLTLQSPTASYDPVDTENTPIESALTPKQKLMPVEKPDPMQEITPSRQNVSVVALHPDTPKMNTAMGTVMKPATPVPEAPKQRLVIANLVLNNFKSYAGRQEVGPFHSVRMLFFAFKKFVLNFVQSFSAVVGPNGSGKSNVIDSLLFVFGFRASKMRQAKLSALIHNSAAYPDLNQCSVEVHFEDVTDNVNFFFTSISGT